MDNMGKIEIGSPIWIEQQRAVCNAATPGKWITAVIVGEQYKCAVASESGLVAPEVKNSADSAFIAAARTALPAALDALEASMQREAEKDAEIERLNEINLLELHQIGESMDMSVDGIPAKTFMAALVKLFETSKATNYLTVTVDCKEHHYGITIQKADGELTPAEHLERLTAEIERLKEECAQSVVAETLNDELNDIVREVKAENVRLTAERDAEKKRAENAEHCAAGWFENYNVLKNYCHAKVRRSVLSGKIMSISVTDCAENAPTGAEGEKSE